MGVLEKLLLPFSSPGASCYQQRIPRQNLSQIFIIWDKLFGTFQEELPEYSCVWNYQAANLEPIKINFQHLWLLMKDAWRTKSWKEKFTLWFKPTGYRPADVAERYPVYKIEDVYHFDKYAPKTSAALQVWSWIQIVFVLLSISYLFGNIAAINKMDGSFIYLYGAFVFFSVYAFTELMDRNPTRSFGKP